MIEEAHVLSAADAPSTSRPPWRYEDALKDLAVEEQIDLLLHRRLGFALIRPLQYSSLAITPTQITVASLVTGVLAAGAYAIAGDHGAIWYLVGSALFLFSTALDCADGMLARLKNITSEFGMVLDGSVDFVVGAAVGLAFARAAYVTWSEWWPSPSTALVALAVMVHIAFYDHFKNIFVRLGKPQHARPATKPLVAKSAVGRAFVFMYNWFYTGVSRVVCGPDVEHLDHLTPAEAREGLMLTMRRTTWLGVGTHFFVLYVAGLLAYFDHRATVVVAHAIITIGLSLWMVVTVVTLRIAARKLRRHAGGDLNTPAQG